MASPPFDASNAVTFDLTRGQIKKEDGEPRLLVSVEALLSLCHAAGADATATFGRAIGESLGAAIARRFERAGASARDATVESAVDHLAGELALGGFGALSLERWGRALVLVVKGGLGGAEEDKLLAPMLAASVSKATKIEVRCVRLSREGDHARFLVTGARGAEKVRVWLMSGVSWGEALVRLHPPPTTRGGGA